MASTSGSPMRARPSRVESAGRDRGQAPLGAAAVPLQVPGDQGLDGVAVVGVEVARRRRGARPAAGPCRASMPGRRRRAGPGRSARSGGRAVRRAGCGRHRWGPLFLAPGSRSPVSWRRRDLPDRDRVARRTETTRKLILAQGRSQMPPAPFDVRHTGTRPSAGRREPGE